MQLKSNVSAWPVPAGTISCGCSAIGSTMDHTGCWLRLGLVAGVHLAGTERFGEALGGAARSLGPRLALMRRPGGQGDDFELRGDPAARVAETLGIALGCAQ